MREGEERERAKETTNQKEIRHKERNGDRMDSETESEIRGEKQKMV